MARKRERSKDTDDPRTTEALVSLLLITEDEHAQWDIILALQRRCDAGVFSAACNLCQSDDFKQRRLGVWILGNDLTVAKPWRRQYSLFLLELIKRETNPEVLAALGSAFGHLKAAVAIRPLRRLRKHSDADVRWHVVYGLLTQTNALAIKTLIELTEDKEDSIRDWATFGLAQQIDKDTIEIREALVRRLNDPDPATRSEALMGLARRKDERVIEPLIAALTADAVESLSVEAAQKLNDSRLLPALTQLQALWWGADDQTV